jgi:hypothetical protein
MTAKTQRNKIRGKKSTTEARRHGGKQKKQGILAGP